MTTDRNVGGGSSSTTTITATKRLGRRWMIATTVGLLFGLLAIILLRRDMMDVKVLESDLRHSADVTTTKKNNKKVSTTTTTTNFATIQHSFPECFVYKSSNLDIPNMGKYIPINEETKVIDDNDMMTTTTTTRTTTTTAAATSTYNHKCFIMKARYNCEYASTRKSKASDYKLVLKQNVTADSAKCDLRRLVNAIGGPQGIGQHVVESMNKKNNKNKNDKNEKDNNNNKNKNDNKAPAKRRHTKFKILLYGSSFLRQIFEALVCGFESQITDFRAQIGGPPVNMAALKKRNDVKLTVDEMEQTTRYIGYEEASTGGCHGIGNGVVNMKPFYRKNVEVPKNIKSCNDNFAMVEFGSVFRVYYVFRARIYDREALEYAMKQIGYYEDDHDNNETDYNDDESSAASSSSLLDLIVSNEDVDPNFFPMINTTREYPFYNVLPVLKKIQKRWTPRYFGADNPWITDPPDNHPCMPGIPDDEVQFLLFKILYDFVLDKKKKKKKQR